MKYSSLFILRAHSCFPCLAAQKTFFSYRNFWNKEFHFLKGKKLAILKKLYFRVNALTFFIIWKNKKTCFALARLVLDFGLFSGFFWPSEGLRPSSGQKNPSNSPQAKTTWLQQKKFFVLPHDSYVGAFLLKIYHFLIQRYDVI